MCEGETDTSVQPGVLVTHVERQVLTELVGLAPKDTAS